MSRTEAIDVARAWHRLCELAGRAFTAKFSAQDVKDARRAAAKRLHPDMAGGSTEKMQEANRLADELEGDLQDRVGGPARDDFSSGVRERERVRENLYRERRWQQWTQDRERAKRDADLTMVGVTRSDLRKLVLLARLGMLAQHKDEATRTLFIRDRDMAFEFTIREAEQLVEAMNSDVVGRYRRSDL